MKSGKMKKLDFRFLVGYHLVLVINQKMTVRRNVIIVYGEMIESKMNVDYSILLTKNL